MANLLTRYPGSSQYFILGVVAYSNKAKEKILKIRHSTIKEYGSVSSGVACLMAQNIRKIAKADFGIGITGIAGPGGGASQKPVGTVFVSIAFKQGKVCKKFIFKGNRTTVRSKSAIKSLELLKKYLR